MDNSAFQTVFCSCNYNAWLFPLALGLGGIFSGGILFFLGVLILPAVLRFINLENSNSYARLRSLMAGGSAVLMLPALVILFATLCNYVLDIYLLSSGKTSYIEGNLENFVPMPFEGHANESFTVKGVPFSYSDYQITGGFNNSSTHGGPLRPGMHVRIWYFDAKILRLDIEDSFSKRT